MGAIVSRWRAVIAEELAGLGRAADQEIPGAFELHHIAPFAEPGRAEQIVAPTGGEAIVPPGCGEQPDQEEERDRARDAADAENAFEPAGGRIGLRMNETEARAARLSGDAPRSEPAISAAPRLA
ncbi:hypothetical protein AV944_18185 (plasmid) [Sphingomonas sp. LK11]|nr:hypothetical protein AV944_18185 [Sphingomonas sp. LK11]